MSTTNLGNNLMCQNLTFLQTILLVVCGWISFYFDIDDFTNRVMVVLTAMLVVATIVSTVQAVGVL